MTFLCLCGNFARAYILFVYTWKIRIKIKVKNILHLKNITVTMKHFSEFQDYIQTL